MFLRNCPAVYSTSITAKNINQTFLFGAESIIFFGPELDSFLALQQQQQRCASDRRRAALRHRGAKRQDQHFALLLLLLLLLLLQQHGAAGDQRSHNPLMAGTHARSKQQQQYFLSLSHIHISLSLSPCKNTLTLYLRFTHTITKSHTYTHTSTLSNFICGSLWSPKGWHFLNCSRTPSAAQKYLSPSQENMMRKRKVESRKKWIVIPLYSI